MSITVDCYSYLASAIAGRRISVHLTTGEETLAYCDDQTILLPRRAADGYGDAWLEVVAQALLLAADSLAVPVLRRLVGRPQAARRYAYLEVRRALRHIESRVPHAFANHSALNIEGTAQVLTTSADESATYALETRRPLPDIPDFIGSVRPLATLRNKISNEGLAALTKKQQQGQFERDDNPPPDQDDDEETESSKILKLFENPLMGRNPLSDMLNKILGMGTSRGNREENPNSGGGSEMPVARIERAWRRGINAIKAVLPFELPDFDSSSVSPQFMYPEWDEFKQQYRKDWVHIDEVDPWRMDGPTDLAGILTPPPRELQRQLITLGLDYEMHRRQLDGAEFDVGRLIECAIDLKTGHSPSAMDVYRASKKTRRDLGVMVVVDISGSTEEKNTKGESVFEHHLRAAWHLAQTFDRLGDRVALYGFQSWGRKLVRMVRLKGHEETWSGRVAERFSLLEPLGYTRTGAAIRHADRLLRTSMRLPNRLLILITDGFSYDQDYEEKYAEADARKALAEARAEGTACVCLCIGGSTSASQLANVFGSANLLMVDDTAQIPGRIRQTCVEVLKAVSRRKVKRAEEKQTV
jgi:nitric oxide reductase activation protein